MQKKALERSADANGQAGKQKAEQLAGMVNTAANAWEAAQKAADKFLKSLKSEEAAKAQMIKDLETQLDDVNLKLSEDTKKKAKRAVEGDKKKIAKLENEKKELERIRAVLNEDIKTWETNSKSWSDTAKKWRTAVGTLKAADGAKTEKGDPPDTTPPTLPDKGGQTPAGEKSTPRTGAAAALSGAALAAILVAISEEKPSPPRPVSP